MHHEEVFLCQHSVHLLLEAHAASFEQLGPLHGKFRSLDELLVLVNGPEHGV